MPRFAVLEHDQPQLHWDLLLEAGPAALTWRLAAPPRRGTRFEAERIGDHRLLYLDYEGPVSGNRGHVRRWDGGSLLWQLQEEQCVMAHLEGGRLRGRLRLERRADSTWEGILDEDTCAQTISDPESPGR